MNINNVGIKIMEFSVPTATVRLSAKIKITSATPDTSATITITKSTPYWYG